MGGPKCYSGRPDVRLLLNLLLETKQSVRAIKVDGQRLPTGQRDAATIVVPANERICRRSGCVVVDRHISERANRTSRGCQYQVREDQFIQSGTLSAGRCGDVPRATVGVGNLRKVSQHRIRRNWGRICEGNHELVASEIMDFLGEVFNESVDFVKRCHAKVLLMLVERDIVGTWVEIDDGGAYDPADHANDGIRAGRLRVGYHPGRSGEI